jgi:hypothetical protein
MWLVRIVEDNGLWMFWRADLEGGCWVSDEGRATRYGTRMAAMAAADDVSDQQGVEARAIAESDLC